MLVAALLASVLFFDDFESGLHRWDVTGAPAIRTVASGDPAHGQVLLLQPAGDIHALIRGSEEWRGVRFEGDVLFPTAEHNYLGVIYNFQRRGERLDFGLIYIKGNGSYLQANPHRDYNVGRLVYPEYHVDLTGDAAVRTAEWQRFAVEVVGRAAHFYVGDMSTPQMTFPFFELDSGAFGLQPRCCGGPVWADNVRVTSIDRLSWTGDQLPRHRYEPASLLTAWEVAGPFDRTRDEIARDPSCHRWRSFPADERGAVVTARIVDYHGPRSAAYFRTRIDSPAAGEAVLHVSSADDLAIWINGRFRAFSSRSNAAWFDFATNPAHRGRRIPIVLKQGSNDIVMRVRGGVTATGAFFARIE